MSLIVDPSIWPRTQNLVDLIFDLHHLTRPLNRDDENQTRNSFSDFHSVTIICLLFKQSHCDDTIDRWIDLSLIASDHFRHIHIEQGKGYTTPYWLVNLIQNYSDVGQYPPRVCVPSTFRGS